LAVGATCVLAMSSNRSEKAAIESEKVTIFLTGNVLGELKPCGCSGGQLGGFEKRARILGSVPASRRLIVDTGSFVESDGEQDMIKLNIVIQALSLLDYDLLRITKEDFERVGASGLLESMTGLFNVISSDREMMPPIGRKFTKSLSLGADKVTVTIAAVNTSEGMIEQTVCEVFGDAPAGQVVNIVIPDRCSDRILADIARSGRVDCVIYPSESDEAAVIGDPEGRPLAVTVGRYGKYVGRLQIEAAAEVGGRVKISFSVLPVTEDLPEEESLVELYKLYQQLVKEEGLLEKHPRFALPDGLKYTGSASCRMCHNYEYEKWSTRDHARAYATLEKVGSQYDPECAGCHVVGMDYQGGFVNEERTGDLKNVGCENCHGPGSEHISTIGKKKTCEPKSACIDCHTPDNSANYIGNERAYLEKIVHWREPNAVGEVQEYGGSEK